MSATKDIKKVMIEKSIKSGALADMLNYDKDMFYSRLTRDTWKYDDVVRIADALGCELKFVDRETGKIY